MLIKGTALRSSLRALEQRCGADAIRRVRAELDPALREVLDGLLPTKHYPPSFNAAVHAAIRDTFGGGDSTINYELGIAAARFDFGGVYSIFLRVADYETSLQRLERAWRQYNSQGSAAWARLGRGSGRCVVEGVEDFSEPMWRSVGGRIAGMLLLAGAPVATATIEAWSDHSCAIDVEWQP